MNDLESTYYMVQFFKRNVWRTLYGPFYRLDEAIAAAKEAPTSGYTIRVAKIHKTTVWMEDYNDEP